MPDVVVTVPQSRWRAWLTEGDLAGTAYGCEYEYTFWLGAERPNIQPAERVYIVAYGRLRGYAPLFEVRQVQGRYGLVRLGGAVAVTLPVAVRGFQGFRYRWWDRSFELPFPDWQTTGVPGLPQVAQPTLLGEVRHA